MKRRVMGLVSVCLLAVSVLAVSNATAGAPVKFKWRISGQFIQNATELTQTGARAQADNLDYARVSGNGKFNSSTGTASGGGLFAHTSQNGTLVGFGTWTVTGLSDVQLFGCGTFSDGSEAPPDFCGGVLTLDVHLSGINVTLGPGQFDGVLVVTCLIGDTPEDIPPGAEEGITLDIPGVINFDDLVPEESGLTLFQSRD